MDIVTTLTAEHSAYDTSLPFTNPLKDFLRTVAQKPYIKLIGICYGHQIIAEALGGKCEPGQGWEVGVYGNDVTEEGKKWFDGDRVVRTLVSELMLVHSTDGK